MKKKFYILLFAMMVAFAANAQRFEYQMGLKAGLGVSFLSTNNDNVTSKSNGLCYKFGFTGIYNFGENYGFTTGFTLLGNSMSYKINVPKVDENGEVIYDSNGNIVYKEVESYVKPTYLQIPLLLKMRTETFAEKFRAFGEIGYGLNILAKKNDKGEYKNSYRDVCSSFIVHLGVEMAVMSRSTLQVMLAYDNNFSSMMSLSSDKFTTSNLCLEVGFLF